MSGPGTVALALLVVAAALCLLRLVRARSIADRVVALDTMLVVTAAGIAVWSADTGRTELLDVMVVVALLGFTGTVTVARFIEARGAQP